LRNFKRRLLAGAPDCAVNGRPDRLMKGVYGLTRGAIHNKAGLSERVGDRPDGSCMIGAKPFETCFKICEVA